MNETSDTAKRLAEVLDHEANKIDRPADLLTRVRRRRLQRRRRRTAFTAAMTVLVIVATVVATTRPHHAPKLVVGGLVGNPTVPRDGSGGKPEAPMSATSVRLLPPAGAAISRLTTYATPTDEAYEQLFVGSQDTNPAELLVETVDTAQGRSGSHPLSTGTWPDRQTVQVGGVTGNLVTTAGTVFVWWSRPDGVEVDTTASGLSAAQVVGALSSARPSDQTRLGFSVPGPLPAGLHLIRSALSEQTSGSLEDVQYTDGGCTAELGVYSGVGTAIGATTGTTRVITFAGQPALISTMAAGPGYLSWTPAPGITAQLISGSACSLLTLARSVRQATPTQFQTATRQLGDRANTVTSNPEPASTTTVQSNTAPEQPVVTVPGPDGTTITLTVSPVAPAGACETIHISDPGISLDPGGGKPAYVAQPTCQATLPTGAGGPSGALWISHGGTRWFLDDGRAPGAVRVEFHVNGGATQVPVKDGWWVAAVPYMDNPHTMAVPFGADGRAGPPFMA